MKVMWLRLVWEQAAHIHGMQHMALGPFQAPRGASLVPPKT